MTVANQPKLKSGTESAISASDLLEGWVETTLDQVLQNLESGSRPKGGVRGITEGIPSIGGEHLNENGGFRFESIKFVPYSFFERMNQGHIQTGDILIVKDGATTGKVALVRDDFPYDPAVVNEHVFICRPDEGVYPAFLFYFLFSDEGQDRILENFRGSAQGGINKSFAPGTAVPLAPLAEQKRIVAKVEELLARVNAARDRLAKVSEILRRFRQSVLTAAWSGRLTADWREINGQLGKSEWVNADFFDFCVLQRGYDLPIAKRKEGPYPIVTSAGVVAYHGEYKMNGPGVLVGRSGSIGKVSYVESNFWPHNTTLFVKDFKGNFPKYVYYFLLGFDFQPFSASTAVPTLNRNNLREAFVEVPPIEEQREIVHRVEFLFKLADTIEKKVTSAKSRANKLMQAVLAKAFRGELVPTEAELARREGRSYEPASALLARIEEAWKDVNKLGKRVVARQGKD